MNMPLGVVKFRIARCRLELDKRDRRGPQLGVSLVTPGTLPIRLWCRGTLGYWSPNMIFRQLDLVSSMQMTGLVCEASATPAEPDLRDVNTSESPSSRKASSAPVQSMSCVRAQNERAHLLQSRTTPQAPEGIQTWGRRDAPAFHATYILWWTKGIHKPGVPW